ncbi:MAG TPA: RHS repeat-associated core domain-containing protein [Thermoanaerobaculia bacterium]
MQRRRSTETAIVTARCTRRPCVLVLVHLTKELRESTLATVLRLSGVDASGKMLQKSSVKPSLADANTAEFTLSAAEWSTLTGNDAAGVSIAATKDLRAAAWSADVPPLPAPEWATATRPVYSTPDTPIEIRESVTNLTQWLASIGTNGKKTNTLYDVPDLAMVGGSDQTGDDPARFIVASAFHALPFFDSVTRLTQVRARWLDHTTGTFLTPDPLGYAASGSNLYNYAHSDPVNARDPTGEAVYLVYRKFNDPTLEKGYPFIGHFYLAFDANGLADPAHWEALVRHIGGQNVRGIERAPNPDAETFSFHPTEVRDGDKRNALVSTLYTDASYVGYNDEKPDQETVERGRDMMPNGMPVDEGVKIWRIPATQQQQEQLYIQAIAQRDTINSGLNTSGSYGLGSNNCGSWAQWMLLQAGLSWPAGATFCNLGGVGIHGPTDIPSRALTAAIGVVGEARKAAREFVES